MDDVYPMEMKNMFLSHSYIKQKSYRMRKYL